MNTNNGDAANSLRTPSKMAISTREPSLLVISFISESLSTLLMIKSCSEDEAYWPLAQVSDRHPSTIVADRYAPILDQIERAIKTAYQNAPLRLEVACGCHFATNTFSIQFLKFIRHKIIHQYDEAHITDYVDSHILNNFFGPDGIYGDLLTQLYEILRPYSMSNSIDYDSAFEKMGYFYNPVGQHAINNICPWLPELSWLTTDTVLANQSRVTVLYQLWITTVAQFVNHTFNLPSENLTRMKKAGMAFPHADQLQRELVYKGKVFQFWDRDEADVYRGWVKTVSDAAPEAVCRIYDSSKTINHHSLCDLLENMAGFLRELSATVNAQTGELKIHEIHGRLFWQKAFPKLDSLLMRNLTTFRKNINKNPSFSLLGKFLEPGYGGDVQELSSPVDAIDTLKLATEADRDYNTIVTNDVSMMPYPSPTESGYGGSICDHGEECEFIEMK